MQDLMNTIKLNHSIYYIYLISYLMILMVSCTNNKGRISVVIKKNLNPFVMVNIIDNYGNYYICCFEYDYFCYILYQGNKNYFPNDNIEEYNIEKMIENKDTFKIHTDVELTKSIEYNHITKNREIDSIYLKGGYNLLLRTYFRKIHNAEECTYFLNTLTSEHRNAVFFPYWGKPYHKNATDESMSNSQSDYILYLLFQNGIYCQFDENLNIVILKKWCNPKAKLCDIPSNNIEYR